MARVGPRVFIFFLSPQFTAISTGHSHATLYFFTQMADCSSFKELEDFLDNRNVEMPMRIRSVIPCPSALDSKRYHLGPLFITKSVYTS